MEESTPHSLESNFMDNFGMTLDQFERLDYYDQENIIKKVALLQYKTGLRDDRSLCDPILEEIERYKNRNRTDRKNEEANER